MRSPCTHVPVFLFSHWSKIRYYSRRREGVQLKNKLLMWKASLELPELGASSRNAPETFVTLRPTQSSKWTWRFSCSFKIGTYTHGKQQTRRARGKEFYQIPGIRYPVRTTWYISWQELETEIVTAVHGWWGLTKGSNLTCRPIGDMNGTHRAHHKAGQQRTRTVAGTRRKRYTVPGR